MQKKLNILGPCSVESFEQLSQVAEVVCQLNVTYLRAQIYKPRTRPDSFQGLGSEGLSILKKIQNDFPTLKFVIEVGSLDQLLTIKHLASIVQIGARNMQNFELLKSVGANFQANWDYVLLKRGFANTLEEWLAAAKYLENYGVPKNKILLCERGSRSFTSPTGVSLDFISALEAQKKGYQIVIDPSHGTKKSEWVLKLAQAAISMNFDGVMIECHPHPEKSISDAEQALSLDDVKIFFNR